MMSIIGIGNGASAIAARFVEHTQYNIYCLNDKVKKTDTSNFKLKSFDSPEEYEDNLPNLKKFFKDVDKHVQVFIMGSSLSSNYSLGILEQLQDKKVDVFYIKPDTDLLAESPAMIEKVVGGILQEYARSGLLHSLTMISNEFVEKAMGNTVPIKNFYDSLNKTIVSAVHFINYFTHNEPEIGNVSRPKEINRIRAIGFATVEKLQENWFFQLDNPREICYYLCVNDKKLESDGGLHKRIVESLKRKNSNAYLRHSYAIYETFHEQDFGLCVAHTNAIQKNTLDNSE
jgi:hypothetical protein|tara:strand:- start:54 stop:914 length:861 start_codon:yes stop_codon:yes gene_type:complete